MCCKREIRVNELRCAEKCPEDEGADDRPLVARGSAENHDDPCIKCLDRLECAGIDVLQIEREHCACEPCYRRPDGERLEFVRKDVLSKG